MKVSEARAFIKDALEYGGSGSYKIPPEIMIVVDEPKKK
jgi:hypothetical protein